MITSFRRILFGVAAAACLFFPPSSRADYQPPDRAVEKLDRIVSLSGEQQTEAFQIFSNLKEIMDSIPASERPRKGMQSRQDALIAIRSILTPSQRIIYDKTPQRLGGGMTQSDPALTALRTKIRLAVVNFAKTSPAVAAEFGGEVRSAVAALGGDLTVSEPDSDEVSSDPALHPDRGTNVVRVTGGNRSGTIKVYWRMDSNRNPVVEKFEKVIR